MDIKTVHHRVKHEGLSFLAITLADYGKATQKWLDHGLVVPSDAPSFKGGSRLTGLPPFLGGFLGRVFDTASGVLLDEPDIEAIYAIRQLTLVFSKIALPDAPSNGNISRANNRKVVSMERERRAMSEFIQCEYDVREADARLFDHDVVQFKRIASLLYDDYFAKLDREVHWARLVPKHGPGTVADRLSSNAKWLQRTWPSRFRKYFPAEEFLIANCRSERITELQKELNIIEPGAEMPVRVITVPKTLKSPRIIAIEPTAMQYAQQALLRSFRDCLNEDGFLRTVIGIDDQVPNQVLAQRGSLSGDLATLDMSEASDRVSSQHVRYLLEDFPELHGAVFSCRSRKADVPGHGVIRLAKFASMGSALCFPIEAVVFLTVVFVGIQHELSTLLSREILIKEFLGRVRIFGDDIIVPREYVLSVVDALENFGFRVNTGKSYWTGRFRESCGREYYSGHDVSIVKVRCVLPTQRQDAEGVISAVALRNQLYWAGLWESTRWLDSYLEKLLINFPNVAPTSPLLGRESALGYQFQRLDPNTHGPLTKGYYVRAKSPIDKLDGEGALLKCLVRHPSDPRFPREPPGAQVDVASVDGDHLERSGRPERVSIKLGWRSPF
jgi:hypothetical protein